ncbi:MAG: hypothetical protein J7K83_03405 [Candidatus Aenigmarchaeota archaeon]|nr:hypothetical protein [Candidatus Aenigmarchaeota archaeon]
MTLKKICPRCGKESKKFYNGLCKDCYVKEVFGERLKRNYIVLYRCKICGKYSFNKKHVFSTLEEAIGHFVRHNKELKISNFKRVYEFNGETLKVKWVKDNETFYEREFKIRVKPFKCQYCQMMLSGYRQAIIQLRFNPDNELMDEIFRYVEKRNRSDPLSFISKIERTKDGIDMYIGSKKVAYELIKLIKSKIEIKTRISRRLMGLKDGKRVYLDTITMRKRWEDG